ncbi:MAG TPA: tRNA epoxyqueuosine(34) reductase QueG [Hyphomicrobiaceae bacterium]|nr:tRNA epoxyqueuosine(34) reductase QueG [Hyphomicrobiaceae bacterium]
MTTSMPDPNTRKGARPIKDIDARLAQWSTELGFDAFGITTPDVFEAIRYDPATALDRFVALGRHGDMDWMETHRARRRDPRTLWPEARSVLMLATSYAPDEDPRTVLSTPQRAALSVYARGKDYHDIIKGRLKQLAQRLASETGSQVKVFVDTAPLMEKPLAAAAGVGWQGKHTNLVSMNHGSWLFLGAILTTAELPASAPHADHCGSCTRCLDICPTRAFPQPYELDARRCIAYLTIEYKGHIAPDLRAAIGNRVFGCDDCLAVCPWNKFAQQARETRFAARTETANPHLADLLQLDDAAFRQRFAGTPIKRTGRDRFMRNVLIATGNTGNPDYQSLVGAHLDDPSPLVRAMAVWALAKIANQSTIAAYATAHQTRETDADVRAEWQRVSAPTPTNIF